MTLEKVIVGDKIEVLENGCVQFRTTKTIIEYGQKIISSFHRCGIAFSTWAYEGDIQ